MIKWIFFDIGSTIVDEDEAHSTRFDGQEEFMREKFGRVLSYDDDILPIIIEGGTKRERSPMKYACDKIALPFPRYKREHEKLYPNAKETLLELGKSYKLGVIANQPPELESSLAAMGLDGIFDAVFGSDDVGMKKPDIDFFKLALSSVGCRADEAVMVGDRIDNDIIPAKSLGMKTVRVKTGFFALDAAKDESEQADAEIESLGELPSAIGKIE